MAKILFRTSGGRAKKTQLGLGHIFRCINLSDELHSHELHFLIEDYGEVFCLLSNRGFKNISLLSPGLSEELDLKHTADYIIKNKINLLIIDKYKITNRFIKKIRNIVNVVVISDLKKISYNSDLVINGFIGFENKIIKNSYGTKCLLGPKYQILNKSYKKFKNSKKKFDLLISLGGYDANNLIEIILKKISKFTDIKIRVILGHATKRNSNLQKILNKSPNIAIINRTNNLKKEISSSKFGICAGGITTYEFACMQVPFAILCQYPHQIITAREWNKRKVGKNLGFIKNNLRKFDYFLNQYIQNRIILNPTELVDGFGGERIAIEIEKILKRNSKIR